MRIEEMRAAGERAMLDYCQTDVAAETIVRLRYDKIALIKDLLNLLNAIGVLERGRSSVKVNSLFVTPPLLRSHRREEEEESLSRFRALRDAWPDRPDRLAEDDLSILRELFGADFLTKGYAWQDAQFFEDF